jgi:stage V sporulation protein D (sporulation-specific penicillin-binding protein)
MKPRLVEMVTDSEGQVVYDSEPQEVGRVVGEPAAKGAVEAMRQVVLRGTGRACQLDRWSCFGKTGTAQIPGKGGYEPGAFTGSFVGGAPVENPRVMCLISIYWPNYSKGHYGATVAAPYVKEVLEKTLEYLEVPPDLPPETPKLAGAAAPSDAATARSPSTTPPATGAGAGAGGAVRMDLSGGGRD